MIGENQMPKPIVVTLRIYFILILLPLFQATAQEQPQVHLSGDVFIEKIGDGVWRHVSYKDLPNLGPVPSNGGIAQFGTEILLIDSAWNDAQTKLILDWIEKELHAKPSLAVFTHSHEDRLGGIHEIHQRGIKTMSLLLTAELAKQRGVESPQQTFQEQTTVTLGKQKIQMQYLGSGHTQDNIVVWLPEQQILFGGCLIKSAQAGDLGNTREADLPQWPKTVEKVHQEFKQAKIVVPGHGDPSGIEAVTHTLTLLQKAPGS
jgi:metallo-beta-lactamase class B